MTWEKNQTWEGEVEGARGTPIGDQVSIVDQAHVTAALDKHAKPLVTALGIPPWGALRKLPKEALECHARKRCPAYLAKECHPHAKKMPWCFEPDLAEEPARKAGAFLIGQWRQGVYVLVVKEESNG